MYLANSILSDLDSDFIPIGARSYIGQRAKNEFYDYVMEKFRASGLTQADIARKIERNPGQINRMLAGPGNWTIETIAELLAAISAEELLPRSQPFKGRAKRNHRQHDMLPPPPRDDGLTRLQKDTESSASKIEFELTR